ncbi:MAG: Fur family transcriptional regulator [Dissulfurispiraceae bacterium]|jgi:Fur family transcriptional regulator, ferric uptake regulator
MDTEQAKKLFSDCLAHKGLRHTMQRDIILNCFLAVGGHITADDLYGEIRKISPDIGIATVHRTLKLLCEIGIAEEIKIGNDKTRYEQQVGRTHHDHLICTRCLELTEVHDNRIETLQDKLAQANGFIPVRHKLEIYGLCKKCK